MLARAPWPRSPPPRPSSHLTSPKLQNPNTVGPPLSGSGTEVGGSGSLTVPLLPPGTPRAKIASRGSGLWTRRPCRLVSSGFQPHPRPERYTAASRDSRPWPGAASERPVTPYLAQALSAPPRHSHNLPPHSSPTVPTGVSQATRRLFATEPGSPTPPPPLDDSPRSLPGGSQIPSPPLAPAVIRSWRPLPGHQEQPRRPLRAGTTLLERRDGLSQILKAVPAPQQARKAKVTPLADQAAQFCHQPPPLPRACIHNTHVQFLKHWKSSVYSVQTKFVPLVSVPLLCLD